MPAVAGHVAQVVAFGSVEYLPTVQFVQTVSLAAVHAAVCDVPAAQTLQGEHASAPALAHPTPAVHLEHTASAVAEQYEAR